MKENGPTTSGEYVDRGPRTEGTAVTNPSYVQDTIRQGRERPRPLTLEETQLAAKNRRIAREDLAAMEAWYRAQCQAHIRGVELWRAQHPGAPWDGYFG